MLRASSSALPVGRRLIERSLGRLCTRNAVCRLQCYNTHNRGQCIGLIKANNTSRIFSSTSLDSFNQELETLIQNGNAPEAHEFLVQMKQDDIDVDQYTSVLDAWLVYQQDPHRTSEELYFAAEQANKILERMSHPSSHHYHVVIEAWRRVAKTKGVPQRAQRVLDQMICFSEPTISSYNAVMETWGQSEEHLRATMAQRIYETLTVSPNCDTLRILIEAWCRSKQKRAAFNATSHLQKMQNALKNGIEEMEPTLKDYHLVFQAWTTAEGKLGYKRAMSLLRQMENLSVSRLTDVRPDETCYKLVLQTLAHNSTAAASPLGELVDGILEQMEERIMIPDTECFVAAIQTWKNAAKRYEELKAFQRAYEAALRALELWDEFKKAFHRTEMVEIRPTSNEANLVMEAFVAACPYEDSVEQTIKLLVEMQEANLSGNTDLTATMDSYIHALNALAQSRFSDKVDRALVIQTQFQQEFENNETAKVQNAVMNVCAHVTGDDEKQRAIKVAFDILTQLSLSKAEAKADSATYQILLQACANLLPPGTERERALQRVFEKCCHAGFVDKGVLDTFRAEVPSKVYHEVVVSAGVEEDGSKLVPEEWTRNQQRRVLTVDGHKPLPLSIEAVVVYTPRMYEHKMRNLRKRKNQRLLRGGRMR